MTEPDDESTIGRNGRMRYHTFLISAGYSSFKYTPQGAKLLSEKAAEAGIGTTFYASVP